MTLTTKKSRGINVAGIRYRYQISTTQIDDDWNFALNLIVQRSEAKGTLLQVKGLATRNFWLDISEGAKWNRYEYPTILPRHISSIIEQAIKAGWQSEKSGKPFVLNAENEVFFKET